MKGSLIGTYYHSVDDKGRLAVPAKLRAELGDPFYITYLSGDCLSVYSEEEWQRLADKLNAVPQTDLKAQRYVRMIFASACRCEPDKQGRVLLPQHLRERVGIDREAVMIGASNRAEIWAKEKWEAMMAVELDGADIMESLSAYGI